MARIVFAPGCGEAAGDAEKAPQKPTTATELGNESKTTLKVTPDPQFDLTGQRIGRYKLLERIGEGGFGEVYMAEQIEPVQRKVAFKIIKSGMDSRQIIARFEAERQALALMDHPNIAKILDAGTVGPPLPSDGRGVMGEGRPYFVMELVRGISITDFCDQRHLTTHERLSLFIKVCHAVQHAHQKGIIHRDIKPSNVLVTLHDAEAVPKVIDFGIAKAIGQRLTDRTLFTGFAQFMGTPAYMSPEQAELSGLDIDTRTDIYSLGVLLYELLTGVTPFDKETFAKAALDEVRRIIRETDPPRPSTRLQTLGAKATQIAKHRQTQPETLRKLMRGDLDWIVMKCLEKDRTRRYETANGVAAEVERFLKSEPVTARPPSAIYQFRKLVHRHKVFVAAAGAVAAALVLGLIGSTWQAFRATRAEREQSRLRQEAEAARIREAAQRVKAENAASIAHAAILYDEGKYEESERLLQTISVAASGPDPTHMGLLRGLGKWHATQNRWREAATNFAVLMKLDELQEGAAGDTAPALMSPSGSSLDYLYLGLSLIELGDHATYESLRRTTVARLAHTTNCVVAERVCRSLLLPADKEFIASLAPLYDLAVKGQPTPGNPELNLDMKAWAFTSLALVDYRRGDYAKCVEWSQRCLATPIRNDARIATAQVIFAMGCQHLNRQSEAQYYLSEAITMIDGSLEPKGRAFGDGATLGPPRLIAPAPYLYFEWIYPRILSREGVALIGGEPARQGRWKAAAEQMSQLLDLQKGNTEHYFTLAALLVASGDIEGYRRFCQEIQSRFTKTKEPFDRGRMAKVCLILPDSGVDLAILGPWAEVAITPQTDASAVPWISLNRSIAAYRQGQFETAIESAHKALTPTGWSDDRRYSESYALMAMAYFRLNHVEDARKALDTGKEIERTRLPPEDSTDSGPGSIEDLIIARALMKEAKGLIEPVSEEKAAPK
jgi:serine/threonine protein kinase/tetratricopeptide (TPR) repeat protein